MTSVQSLITCAAMFKQFTVHLAVHVLVCSINYDERRPRIECKKTALTRKALFKMIFMLIPNALSTTALYLSKETRVNKDDFVKDDDCCVFDVFWWNAAQK